MGTNEPTLMRDLAAAHGRVIYKPTSGPGRYCSSECLLG
jgi:hypothetical protein